MTRLILVAFATLTLSGCTRPCKPEQEGRVLPGDRRLSGDRWICTETVDGFFWRPFP